MTKAEIEYENEIKRLKEAVAKSNSDYLKRDYKKKIVRMQNELKEYRKFRYS